MKADIDWSVYPEPFRTIGIEFAEMLPALVRGDPAPQPSPAMRERLAVIVLLEFP